MKNKFTAALCLSALLAIQFAALAAPLIPGNAPDCCSGTMCPMHHHPSADSSDCDHSSRMSDCACSMSACNPAQPLGVWQPYLPALHGDAAPQFAVTPAVTPPTIFASSVLAEVESPPPRTALA